MMELRQEVTCYNCRSRNHYVSSKEFDRELAKYYQKVKLKRALTIEKRIRCYYFFFFAAFYMALCQYDVVHIYTEKSAMLYWFLKLFGKR